MKEFNYVIYQPARDHADTWTVSGRLTVEARRAGNVDARHSRSPASQKADGNHVSLWTNVI